MTAQWFGMFALGMLGGAVNSKGLAATIVYGLALLAMYPTLDYALELAALYAVAQAATLVRT